MNDMVKISNSIDANAAIAEFVKNNEINIGNADPQDLKYVLDSFQKRVLNKISRGQVATIDDFDSKERERFEIAVEQVKNWGADVAHTGLTKHYFYKTRNALHAKTQNNTNHTPDDDDNIIAQATDEISLAIQEGLRADIEAEENAPVPTDIIEGLSQIKEIETDVPVTGEIKTPDSDCSGSSCSGSSGDCSAVPENFERPMGARPTKENQNEAPAVNEFSDEQVSAAVIPALRSLATFEPENKQESRKSTYLGEPVLDTTQQKISNGEKVDRPSVFKKVLKSFSALVNSPRISRFVSRVSTARSVATVVAALGVATLMSSQTSSNDFKDVAQASDKSVMEHMVADNNIAPEITNLDKIVIGNNETQPITESAANAEIPEVDFGCDIFDNNDQDTTDFIAEKTPVVTMDAPERIEMSSMEISSEVPALANSREITPADKVETLITDGQQIADLGQKLSETVKGGINHLRQDVALAFAAEKAVSDFMTSTSAQVSAVAKQFDAYNQSKVIADIERVDNADSVVAGIQGNMVADGTEGVNASTDEVQVAAAGISFTQKSVKTSTFEVEAPVNYAALMKGGFTGSVMGDSFVTDAPSEQGASQFSSSTIQTVVNNNPTHPDLTGQAEGSENAVPQFGFVEKDDTSVPVTEKSDNNGLTVTASFMADAMGEKATPDDKAIITASFMADAMDEKETPDDKAIITASFKSGAKSMEVAKAEIEVKNAPEMPATASGKVHSNPVTLENAGDNITKLFTKVGADVPKEIQKQLKLAEKETNNSNYVGWRTQESLVHVITAAKKTFKNDSDRVNAFNKVVQGLQAIADANVGSASKRAARDLEGMDWLKKRMGVKGLIKG